MKILFTALALLLANVSYASDRIIVYFGATWCPSCIQLEKVFLDPAIDTEIKSGKMVLKHVDTDQNPVETEAYTVTVLPTVIVVDTDWKQSTEVARFTGNIGKVRLLQFLKGLRK